MLFADFPFYVTDGLMDLCAPGLLTQGKSLETHLSLLMGHWCAMVIIYLVSEIFFRLGP